MLFCSHGLEILIPLLFILNIIYISSGIDQLSFPPFGLENLFACGTLEVVFYIQLDESDVQHKRLANNSGPHDV